MAIAPRNRLDESSPDTPSCALISLETAFVLLLIGPAQLTNRRLLTAAIASLSLSLAALALVLGVADLASVSARVWMREWEQQGRISDPAQWDDAYRRISLARSLNPLSSDHSADLGRLMDWQALRQTSESAESATFRTRAGHFHGEAIGKRPGWGYAWAHYAENQLLQGNRGPDFFLALEKAIVLAPWEPGVQLKIAWIGMASWDDLPHRLRVIVEEGIQRAVNTDANLIDTVRLAVQYGWLDHLAPMMRTERQLAVLEHVARQVDRR